jgi:predicted hydrolase (HD superfamily)
MIPSEEQVKLLWQKYHLPREKQIHVNLVAKVAIFLAEQLKTKNHELRTDIVVAAALLHDLDKNIPKLPGEMHPDTCVRVLKEEGMEEVAELVKTHPLHTIVDPLLAPKTREEKVLFLADKMVKYEVITVDKRFRLWNDEHLPVEEQAILDASYPKVKQLEREIFSIIDINPSDVVNLVR